MAVAFRHGGVGLLDGDAVHDRAHVAERADGNSDSSDLAARHRMIGVVAGLRRQVERDGQAGLTLREIALEALVRHARVAVPGVGSENPGLVGHEAPSSKWQVYRPRRG